MKRYVSILVLIVAVLFGYNTANAAKQYATHSTIGVDATSLSYAASYADLTTGDTVIATTSTGVCFYRYDSTSSATESGGAGCDAVNVKPHDVGANTGRWIKVSTLNELTVTGDLTVGGDIETANSQGNISKHDLIHVFGTINSDSSIGELAYSLNSSGQGTSFDTGVELCNSKGLICSDAGTFASGATSSTCTTVDPTAADTAFWALCTNSTVGAKISSVTWKAESYHGYIYITGNLTSDIWYSKDGVSWGTFSVASFCNNAEFGGLSACRHSFGIYHDELKDVLYMGITSYTDEKPYIAYCKKTDNTLCDTVTTEWKTANAPTATATGSTIYSSLGWDGMSRLSDGMYFGLSTPYIYSGIAVKCNESTGGDTSVCDHADDYTHVFAGINDGNTGYNATPKITDIVEYGITGGTKYKYFAALSSDGSTASEKATLYYCNPSGRASPTECEPPKAKTQPACDATCDSTSVLPITGNPFVNGDVIYVTHAFAGLSADTAYAVCAVSGNNVKFDTPAGTCSGAGCSTCNSAMNLTTASANAIRHIYAQDSDWIMLLSADDHNQAGTIFAGVLTMAVTADNKLLIGWGAEGDNEGAYLYRCDLDSSDSGADGICNFGAWGSAGVVGDIGGDWRVLKGTDSSATEDEITRLNTIGNDTFISTGNVSSIINRQGNLYLYAKDSACTTTQCLSVNLLANPGTMGRFKFALKHSDNYVYFIGESQDRGMQVYRMPAWAK